ncbi:MAG: hypothetical protein ACRDFY_08100, partial [Candidatus Limnocylindria bacterium]
LLGLALAALTASTASATLEQEAERPTAVAVTIAEVADGGVTSGLWIEFDAELVEGPHRSGVQVGLGAGADTVERVYYLVADPVAPGRALVVRFAGPIPALESASGPVRLDGTITQDAFNMRSLLAEWDISERHPDLQFSETRLIAYAFATPFVEPSWLGTIIMGIAAAALLLGAFVPYPVVRPVPATAVAGQTPISLAIHGTLATPRGPVRLHGTPARLEWMDVEEVARTRWRYWGAGLGDMRQEVEEAVRAHGRQGERLVIHGPAGSVIWPIEAGAGLEVEPGEAYAGLASHPALRVHGNGSTATLTFADAASRNAAAAALQRGDSGQ